VVLGKLTFARPVTGVVCLLACGWALFSVRVITVRAVPMDVPLRSPLAAERAPGRAEPPAREQWVVRVDGWSLGFDGVRPGAVPTLDPPAGEDDDDDSPPEFSSPYDTIIRHCAATAGFDWRFVSALIYEESRFVPDSESEKGAYGLMQVRDIAAREVGAISYASPAANIRAGVRYLQRLSDAFSAASERDHLALMLAAYNMGPAHVEDAQVLAKRLGFETSRWDSSMELVLPLLEQPAFYEQLPNGYAQGRVTVGYVNRVLDRYARDPRDRDVVSRARDQAASASG
jgi:soluble lytic murein transglycosylase-like protein